MKATWSREFRTELFKRIEDVIKERHRRIEELQVIYDAEVAAYKAKPWYIRWAFNHPANQGWFGSDACRRLQNNKYRIENLEALCDKVRGMFSGGATAITLQDEEVRWVQ